MIYEMRTYRVKVHAGPSFLEVYASRGIQIIGRYAKLVGCWETESGNLNEIVFIWAYDDFNHRIEQRNKLWRDPDWLEFVPSIRQHMEHQRSAFLMPAAFSPLK
ncbi:MAG: NIPSNAP family protein [Burkholderiales bacterium]|nr:NIPSNAP family protein [Burkholderiales bacterium]OJX00825.1 MAG: NIPSNAP family protein [Burkholderiales bacterium 70-64]